VPQFEQNLKQMIARVRGRPGRRSSCSPRSAEFKWRFGPSHAEYASARSGCAQAACAYADVFGNWQALAARKSRRICRHNINHPNDFGHWIYFRVLSAMNL